MRLEELYINIYGESPTKITPLTPAGSNRRYFRLFGKETVIGVIGVSHEENEAFLYLQHHFSEKGLPVPGLLAETPDGMEYLLEDLGDMPLFSVKDDIVLLEKTIRCLPDFQFKGGEGLDYSKCYPVAEFDSQAIMWDLNYFKYCYLNTTGVPYKEDLLEQDFKKMAIRLSDNPYGTFMYRDFQSRNVMIKDGKPYFIDFQGGRKGPCEYDVVSFIWQAKAAFPATLKEYLLDVYLDSAKRYADIDPVAFKSRVGEFALLRTLQVLGAYGFRGKFERKRHFLESIPLALRNLKEIISASYGSYPYLTSILKTMLDNEMNYRNIEDEIKESPLVVTVTSFSYKRGIPEDVSGNGGGFVFDCRAMDNPGRYAEYKSITGLDKPVIDFLENRGEIQQFLRHCYALIDSAVDNYIDRGFSSLMVSFGCTGGQHRSVYSAQHMALHIKERFPNVKVHLLHREQKIDEWI